MEVRQHAKDVAVLFSRAGLRGCATYHEFQNRRPPVVDCSGSQAPQSEVLDEGVNTTGADPLASVGVHPERTTQALDHLLDWASPGSKAERHSATTIALFSLAGGVGKTTLAFTLGRILSGSNRRVILVNCAARFAMQHLYGPHAQTIGPFTFLHASRNETLLPLTLIEAGEPADDDREDPQKRILDASLGADAMLLDLPATSCNCTHDSLKLADHVLIPILPDMHSAVTLQSVEALIRSQRGSGSKIHYVLNRYDASRPAHREMRERFQTMLGSALLPFTLREEPQIQEAMRCGETIVDFAPQTEIVTDLKALGKWVVQLSPRSMTVKGMTA